MGAVDVFWNYTLKLCGSIILIPKAHDHSDLRQGSRVLALSNTGSLRFTDFPSNLANLIG